MSGNAGTESPESGGSTEPTETADSAGSVEPAESTESADSDDSAEPAESIHEFTEPTEGTLLSVEDLTAGYGDTVVVTEIDLHVDEGEVVTLIGPNGAGKSTVMKAVYGFNTIHEGRVVFDGRDITYLDPVESLTAGMAYVLQESSIFPKMTVHENLLMGGFVLGDDETVRKLVERSYEQFPRLDERRGQKARTLSGGERRLLEVARALILDPDMLLLDEPSIGLEPTYADMVFEKIRGLVDRGKTIMMVEQNAERGLSVADRGYVLADGRLKFEGTGRQLLEDEEVGELYLGG